VVGAVQQKGTVDETQLDGSEHGRRIRIDLTGPQGHRAGLGSWLIQERDAAQLIDAETALRVGLVSQMVEPDEVLTAALAVAAKITANAPIAVRRTKARARAGTMLPVENAYRLDLGPDPRESRDRREGIAAFVEKRQPNWENA
jgi:hypothetical protein